jgi:hypothetical protein
VKHPVHPARLQVAGLPLPRPTRRLLPLAEEQLGHRPQARAGVVANEDANPPQRLAGASAVRPPEAERHSISSARAVATRQPNVKTRPVNKNPVVLSHLPWPE